MMLGDNGYALPLEIAGVLLLAAIIGAIVMAREK
jgi:NADH:ubiquinone oxidoreductase subunit 6 (subunit J)